MASEPSALASAISVPKYVASFSGTSEKDAIASNASRKSAGYEAPRPLFRPARA
jgi:hypothetical protein